MLPSSLEMLRLSIMTIMTKLRYTNMLHRISIEMLGSALIDPRIFASILFLLLHHIAGHDKNEVLSLFFCS